MYMALTRMPNEEDGWRNSQNCYGLFLPKKESTPSLDQEYRGFNFDRKLVWVTVVSYIVVTHFNGTK